MAARRFTGSKVNWSQLTSVLVEQDKAHFTAFKSKYDGYLRKLAALPEEIPKIDWAAYKSKVPNPAIVDEFKKQYEAIQIPFPADTETAKIAEEEKKAAAAVATFINESNERIAKFQKEYAEEKSLIPITEMTLQEVAIAYPDLVPQPLTNPTFWPHGPEDQITKEDEEWWEKRKKNLILPDH